MSAPAIPTFDEFSRKQADIPDFDEWSKGANQGAQKESPGFLKTYTSDLNPMNLARMIRHPIDTLKTSFGPGAWVTPEEALKNQPSVPELAGHAAAILTGAALTKAPAIARATKIVAPGAIQGGWDAATAPSTFRIRGTPVQVPVPASVAAGGLGYEVGRHIPFVNPEVGGAIGGAVGASVPAIRGAYRGGMAAWRARPQPMGPQQPLFGKPSIFNMPGAPDTSGPTGNTPKTPRQIGAAPPEPLPTSRQVEAGATRIVTPPPEDTSGVIPGWKPTVLPREGTITVNPETPDLRISSPKPAPATIQVPAQGAADVVDRVEHPPFAPDRPFPASQKIREQTPAPNPPAAQAVDAQVDRLRQAFPWETDQQLRARAGHSNVMNRIQSTPGAMDAARKLKQSLGGQ